VLGQVGETYRGDTEAAVNEITKRIREAWRVGRHGRRPRYADRIAELLTEHELPVRLLSSLEEPPVTGLATVVTGSSAMDSWPTTFGSPSSPHPICPGSG
jgi:transcription-repair coupling factor (superfamily II helicase)